MSREPGQVPCVLFIDLYEAVGVRVCMYVKCAFDLCAWRWGAYVFRCRSVDRPLCLSLFVCVWSMCPFLRVSLSVCVLCVFVYVCSVCFVCMCVLCVCVFCVSLCMCVYIQFDQREVSVEVPLGAVKRKTAYSKLVCVGVLCVCIRCVFKS